MIELSICDICNMLITILINLLFIFSFFFFLLFLSSFSFLVTAEMFCVMLSFLKKKYSKMKEK